MLPRIRQWLIPHGKDAKDNHGPHSDQAKDTSPQPPQINHINTPKPELGNYHGLVNFGNTCYCNSVIQVKLVVEIHFTKFKALFFCDPFRERVLEYRKQNKKGVDSLLSALSDLFWQLQKRRSNSIKPTKFIQMLKKEHFQILFFPSCC